MTPQNDIQISGSQLMYERPEALHSAVHAELRFQPRDDLFSVAAKTHLVPLLVGEFAQAALHFPIIFVGLERHPVAVLGLKEGQNLFMEDGKFDAGVYLPAYVRRYPFTLAATEGDEAVVCIDAASPSFSTEGQGKSLFEGGQATKFTNDAIAFLNDFEAERKRTTAFVRELETSSLFEVKTTSFIDAQTGRHEHVADYFSISEEKLLALDPARLGELAKAGDLLAVYAHLMSLHKWDAVISRQRAALAHAAQSSDFATPSKRSSGSSKRDASTVA